MNSLAHFDCERTTPSLTDACRNDFAVLNCGDERPPAYLDSGATTLRPKVVVDAMRWYLEQGTAAIHRGVHQQAIHATDQFEETRSLLAGWLGADSDEIIFTSGTTAGINLVRQGLQGLQRVAVTVMEHHSNLVPWMDLENCKFIPVDDMGQIDMEALEAVLKEGVDLLAVTHVSNVLGCVTPIKSLIEMAHRYGAKVLVDAAQSASHHPIDVRSLDVDFLVCSSHKMLGPSGAGALFASRAMHDQLQPVAKGGQMVDDVTLEGWTLQPAPYCYEAGSPAAESVIGWGAAIQYLDDFGVEAIGQRLKDLTHKLVTRLQEVPGIRILGPEPGGQRGPMATFTMEGLEAHAVAKILSQRERVLVRSGFHCAKPLHRHLGLGPTVRASLQIYNNDDDIDRLIRTLCSLTKLQLM